MAFENTIRELERKRSSIDTAIEALKNIDEAEGSAPPQLGRVNRSFAAPDKVDRRKSVSPEVMEKRRQAMRAAWDRRRAREAEERGKDPEALLPKERAAEVVAESANEIAGVVGVEDESSIPTAVTAQPKEEHHDEPIEGPQQSRYKGRGFKVKTTH